MRQLPKDFSSDAIDRRERIVFSCFFIQALLGLVQGTNHPYYTHRRGVIYAYKLYMTLLQGEKYLDSVKFYPGEFLQARYKGEPFYNSRWKFYIPLHVQYGHWSISPLRAWTGFTPER